MKYHELCIKRSPLSNVASLLGLGEKFYLQSRTFDMKQIKEMIAMFECDAIVKCCVMWKYRFDNNKHPEPYFKFASTNIPHAPSAIDGAMIFFEKRCIEQLWTRMPSIKIAQLNFNKIP